MSSELQKLRARGLIHDVSHFEELDRLLQSESVTFYCGFDPTADSLHVGSMLPLLIMRRLQRAGHRPLVILGSGTGMIGDPSGKTEERKLLSDEIIEQNLHGMEPQLKLFLSSEGKNAFQILRNDTWLRPLSCIEFLRDVGKHFSVNMMLGKESVKGRIENREHGISYTEFSYMLLQAYDFYWLYKHKGCRLQVGGSDQWGNITAGVELIRRKEQSGTSHAFGCTFPLLTTSTGKKFGKTEQGNVWLDPKKTSPYRFYQYWVNTADGDVISYLKYFTEIDGEELTSLEQGVAQNPEARLAQQTLARTLTEIVHGANETTRAISASKVLFGEKIENIDEATLLDIFADVPSTTIPRDELTTGLLIGDLLKRTGLASSKGEAKRLIEGGGIYINNVRVTDSALQVSSSHLVTNTTLVLRSGKKSYHLVLTS